MKQELSTVAIDLAKKISLNVLQSRGGSLHLPLFQNGACPFPSTPLLSVLMLVTHTVREIVPMLPRLRIVAVSMQRLEVRHACIAAVAIDMINFNPIRKRNKNSEFMLLRSSSSS
jgi:hypothetical protein